MGHRVTFEPLETRDDQGHTEVFGALLRLSRFGAGATLATAEPQPGTLRFHGRYLKSALEQPLPTFEPFASLDGLLQLLDRELRFSFAPASQLLDEKPPTKPTPRRTLELDFDVKTFSNIPTRETTLRTLQLPVPPDESVDYAYFELGVSLHVAGTEEAPVEKNAVLDMPLRPMSTGLVLEWSEALSDEVPAGLTLIARQGNLSRSVSWTRATVRDGRRCFLFRGITDAEPIDLEAHFGNQKHVLWDAQRVNDPNAPPAWKATLEQLLLPPGDTSTERDFTAEGPLNSNAQVSRGQRPVV